MKVWIKAQEKKIRELKGMSISSWSCIEMALSENEEPECLIWNDSSVPYLQAGVLYAKLGNRWIQFLTSQDDDEFGLCIESSDMPDGNGISGIYRFRELPALPVGIITGLEVKINCRSNIEQITIKICNDHVGLYAGEVYENRSGSFEIQNMDESVLVQVNGGVPVERT